MGIGKGPMYVFCCPGSSDLHNPCFSLKVGEGEQRYFHGSKGPKYSFMCEYPELGLLERVGLCDHPVLHRSHPRLFPLLLGITELLFPVLVFESLNKHWVRPMFVTLCSVCRGWRRCCESSYECGSFSWGLGLPGLAVSFVLILQVSSSSLGTVFTLMGEISQGLSHGL